MKPILGNNNAYNKQVRIGHDITYNCYNRTYHNSGRIMMIMIMDLIDNIVMNDNDSGKLMIL